VLPIALLPTPLSKDRLLQASLGVQLRTTFLHYRRVGFRRAAAKQLKGILTVSDDPLVSVDIIGTTYSAVIDSELTEVMDNNLAHIVAWYDNLNAYCLRLVDLCEYMASKL